jgi:hypothetical protein
MRSPPLLWIVLLHQTSMSSREVRVGGPNDGHCTLTEWSWRKDVEVAVYSVEASRKWTVLVE